MSVALALGLGFFVLTAVASVLAVGLVSGYQNTVQLLHKKAELLVNSEVNQTRFYLEAARSQVDFVVEQIEAGEVEPGRGDEFAGLIMGALAATPQIIALQYVDLQDQLTGVEREDSTASLILRSIRDDDDLRHLIDRVRADRKSRWGKLLWREEYAQATLNYHAPVLRGDRLLGTVTALVSSQRLSELISDLETEFGANAFILYGRDQVLAHPLLAFGYSGLTRLTPLPQQVSFGDPVIAAMWEEQHPGWLERAILTGSSVRFVRFGKKGFIVLFEELTDYADRALVVGTHLPSIDLLSEMQRLQWAIVLCGLISLISAFLAGFFGRQIARPVRRLSDGARKIHDLELTNVKPIPGSFFRELNDAAFSFNTMLDGLRWFERYVPKTLVRRLIRLHQDAGIDSSYRDVVIMFTDIVGFTRLSEKMTAPDAAELLNQHFSTVARCVEAEDGTIDKFSGDSVMAIWGALEQYEDFADRACRAALAIKRAVLADNVRQRREGGAAIRMRIGVHTGRVVVGNIGSPGRINYTVVGDAVNVARRLEELGKTAGQTSGEVNILVSGAVRSALVKPIALTHVGSHELRGRTEHIEVYELSDEAESEHGETLTAKTTIV
jgi:class 3 adenylate cyclase